MTMIQIIISVSFRLNLAKEQIRKVALPQCPPLRPAQAEMKVLVPKKSALHLDEASSRFGEEREQPALLI